MKTPHKHAEVAIAWLQDQSIKLEYKHPDDPRWTNQSGSQNPITQPAYEWRIEPKPDVVKYGLALSTWYGKDRTIGDNLKLTFDGETGKLKSAEVIS